MIDPGVGRTAELRLRVSVATLARVVFPNPGDNLPMLALEQKGTVATEDGQQRVIVRAQPFGGAIRIGDIRQPPSGYSRLTLKWDDRNFCQACVDSTPDQRPQSVR